MTLANRYRGNRLPDLHAVASELCLKLLEDEDLPATHCWLCQRPVAVYACNVPVRCPPMAGFALIADMRQQVLALQQQVEESSKALVRLHGMVNSGFEKVSEQSSSHQGKRAMFPHSPALRTVLVTASSHLVIACLLRTKP